MAPPLGILVIPEEQIVVQSKFCRTQQPFEFSEYRNGKTNPVLPDFLRDKLLLPEEPFQPVNLPDKIQSFPGMFRIVALRFDELPIDDLHNPRRYHIQAEGLLRTDKFCTPSILPHQA